MSNTLRLKFIFTVIPKTLSHSYVLKTVYTYIEQMPVLLSYTLIQKFCLFVYVLFCKPLGCIFLVIGYADFLV